MKQTILTILSILITSVCYSQIISINALVVDEKIPDEAARQLETKLQNALTTNGYADNGYTERFVLTAKVDITQKDVTPTTPARISEKMDITLMVGDVVENKLFASVTLQSAGIGLSENKAFINAFRMIKGDNPKIQLMLTEAKTKIVDYYNNNCPEFIQRAKGMVAKQAYEEAIFMLNSVPSINYDCFAQCQQQAGIIYQQMIDSEAVTLIEKAKTVWAANQNEQGANEVADIISRINPKSANYAQVISLRNSISAKLQADAKQEWEFKMKQYRDNQAYQRSLIDAAKAIGVAWGKNQPRTIYRTVIQHWW